MQLICNRAQRNTSRLRSKGKHPQGILLDFARRITTMVDAAAKKILLIDDDPLIVRMYERKLVKEGFAVTLASNGEEGLKAIENDRPDLVLLDVLMPKMNGWEMLKKLKGYPKAADIPVITLTSLGDRPEDIQKFK